MFAQTADELLLAFRQDVDDVTAYHDGDDTECLWKDHEIYRYMSVGGDALAKLTHGLYKVVRLPYTANSSRVALPRYVLEIRNVWDATHERHLEPANINSIDSGGRDNDYGFERGGRARLFLGTGEPSQYVRDYDAKHLRLVPTPNAAGEIEVQCSVTLNGLLAAGDPLPFTDSEDLNLILEYMRYLAYKKPDAETEDLVRSRAAKQAFDEGAIERKSSLGNYRRTPGVIRMEGW